MRHIGGNQLIDPHLLFKKIGLQKNMQIADFGCGRTGQIVFPASFIVGDHGLVYAVDIMQDILENTMKRAQMEGLVNLHTVWSDIESIGKTAIPEKSLDIVFFINIMHHLIKREAALDEANRLLKNKARILVVDWVKSSLPIAPRGEKLVDFGKIIEWAKSHNFSIQEQFEAGSYHKGLILYKNE